MNRYIRQLMMVLVLSSMQGTAFADVLYHIPHIDPVRVDVKKEHFNRKYTRSNYMRYTSLALLGVWITYVGYKRFIEEPALLPDSTLLPRPERDLAEVAKEVAVMHLEIDHLKKNMELVKGNNWFAWGGDLMHHAIWGIELTTLCKIGAAISAAPTIARVFGPLLDVDELWYELRSDIDFIKGINAKARYMAQRSCDPDDQDYLCRVTQDTAILLKKQIESLIGFVRHKQEQYRIYYPSIASQVDDQIRHIEASFNSFADEMNGILNESDIDKLPLAIIELSRRFGEDYWGVKEQLKALETRLFEELPEECAA